MLELLASLQEALSGRYRLERELGHGGMALVYLGQDLAVPRRVAIKVLRPELAGMVARERFLREIRIASSLVHPNILPLLDAGTASATANTPALPYFTMPFVEGETLRARVEREHQLPLDDALRIAHEVAAALGYAHDHGVVHRDIKPENILLVEGHALVADFGIARAISESVDADAITSAGLVVGTAMYMSPEQASGHASLDGRSDLYALGCVLYEMLAGEPPFTGATAHATIARHQLDPVPSLRTVRSTVPVQVEATVMRALAKSPADRFQTAAQFAAAVAPGTTGDLAPAKGTAGRWNRRRRWGVLALAIGAVAAVYALGANRRDGTEGAASAAALDTTRYAILEIAADSALRASLQPEILLQDALGRWQGVNPVDLFQVRDLLARQDTAGFLDRDWQRLARSLGAGRYVRGAASLVGDSIRVTAALYDATAQGDPMLLRSATVRLPSDFSSADATFGALADSLLLASTKTRRGESAGQSRSLPARQAFEEGSAAIAEWDLPGADSSFAAAVRFDPGYVQSHLWLALVRLWTDPKSPATWRSSAERAVAGEAELSPRDRRIADAALAQGRGDMLQACEQWRELTGEYPNDFVAWYGLATCLRYDRLVVRDRRSPTGWRFRSSYNAAIEAYERAYALAPSLLRGLRAESYSRMVHLMLASGTDFRRGDGVSPEPAEFFAFPSWEGDTLVLYPRPVDPVTGIWIRSTPAMREAINRQRQRLHDFAVGWVLAEPRSADALQALGVSLQLLGDRSALDTLMKARSLARDPGEVIRVGTSVVWARVLFNLPGGTTELVTARRLADSLLAHASREAPLEPKLLASLAALTGRAELAVRLGRVIGSVDRMETPPALVGIGISFLTYAALGGPRDSLAPLAQRVERALETGVATESLAWAQEMWLQLPVLIGFPAYAFPEVTQLARSGSGLMSGYAAYLRADTAGALRAIQSAQSGASGGLPGSRTIDMGYGTAWLLAEFGETRAAAASVDEILSALPQTPPQLFLEVYQVGPLVRAMALRAELAERLGDRETARKWATAVATLWSDADPFLQPTIARMEQLSHSD